MRPTFRPIYRKLHRKISELRLSFLPSDLDNLLFWTKAENKPRTDWNVAGFQLDNEANASLNAKLYSGGYIDFESANSDYTEAINIGNIRSIEFWINTDTNTESWIDLNGTANIEVSTGTITVNNWAGTTIKVNGSVSSTISASTWSHVIIYSSTQVNASAFEIGRISTSYGDFLIKDVAVYSDAESDGNYINPNAFLSNTSSDANCLGAWTFSEGIIENGNPILDYSGNNNYGTFVTSAAGAYDAAGNDSEVGYQTALSAFSLYTYFDGVDDRIQLPSTFTMAVGQYVEIAGLPLSNEQILLTEDISVFDFIQIQPATGYRFRINGTIYTHSESVAAGYHTLRLTRISSSQYSLSVDGATAETFSESNAIVFDFGQYTNPTTTYWSGLVDYFDINGTVYSSFNGFSGATVSGSPTKRRILSPDGTADQFGNTVQYKWTEGVLNFNGGFHGGAEIGTTVSGLDADNLTVFSAFTSNLTATDQILISTRETNSGYNFFIDDIGDVVRFGNEENGGSGSGLSGTTDVVDGTWFFGSAVREADGTTNIYIGDTASELSSDVTEASTLTPGDGSEIPTLGIRSNGINVLDGYLIPYVYEKILTLNELNQLRTYVLPKINAIEN